MLKRFLKVGLLVAVMAIPTGFLFGPIGGFHHMILFGILRYMLWDGEDPTVVNISLGQEHFEVLVDPFRLTLTVAIWLILLVFVAVCVFGPRHLPSKTG